MKDTYATRPALFGWIMFDWAAQPVFLLIQTFFFGPYFVAHFIGDPVVGQTLWGYIVSISGLFIALTSPIFGAIADHSGHRKKWIFVFSLMLCVGSTLLWFAAPGEQAPIVLVMMAAVVAFIGVEFATVFTNAMLPSLVPLNKVGRLSGTGWATGYAGGLIALIIFLACLLPVGDGSRTMLGLAPLIALDITTHEADRASGPFSAIWYLIFVLPFFLLTPDTTGNRRSMPIGAAARAGISELRQTLTHIRANSLIAKFLLARMLYADGLAAIFAFGAIYGASVFGWGATDLGVFAIILTIAGLIGAFIGGYADDKFGARPVIITGLLGLIAFAALILSIDRGHVGWWISVSPGVAETMFTVAGAGIGLTAGPIQSSSRSLMARLTPPEKASEFFGFFAFSGKATAFAAPFMVSFVTMLSGSQRIGMSVIAVFIVAGFVLLRSLDLPRSAQPPVNAGSV